MGTGTSACFKNTTNNTLYVIATYSTSTIKLTHIFSVMQASLKGLGKWMVQNAHAVLIIG